jgi:hypothetical protein
MGANNTFGIGIGIHLVEGQVSGSGMGGNPSDQEAVYLLMEDGAFFNFEDSDRALNESSVLRLVTEILHYLTTEDLQYLVTE